MIAALRAAFTRAAALAAGLVLLLAATDAAAQRAFTTRFTTNANGDVRMIGNANMTCPIGAANCAAARAGGNFADNDFTMEDIDVDLDATTFNSSSADLSVPAGSTVLFAGLYWGANTANAARNQVLLQRPGGFGYMTVTASQVDTTGSTQYGAFADVTSQVAAGGSGTYTVANIQRTLGTNQWAGWSMIVVYGNNAATLKNMTVFDGFQVDPVSTTVSGFLTPLSGPITTRLGFVGYDGDRDDSSAGEAFTINGAPIVDGQNPALNFYNSTISNLGSPFTARNPNYNNTLGLDIDLVNSPAGALGNGATSATITLGAANEEIWIHAVAFATDIYVPIITPNVIKTATDVNGGGLNRGDVLRFNISMSNTGQDTGTNVILTDNIPANTTYVPGSLIVTAGANAGAKSDTPGNDQAEFATGPNRVIFRLGTGANAVSGGTLANGQSTAVQFDVTIDAATPPGTQISNTASISYSGQTLGASFGTTSAAANATVLGPPTIAKSFAPAAIANGGTSVLTIQVASPGANPANLTGVTFTDTYPANLVNTGAPSPNITCTAGSTAGTVTAAPGGNSVALSPGATIAPGGSCTVTVNVTSATDGAYNNVTGAVASTNGGTGTTANAMLSVGKPSIVKGIAPASILSGATATVTLTLQNPTAIALTNVAFTDTLVGMTVAATPAITNTCGGTFSAPALGTSTSLSAGALGAGASCVITFAITSTTTGIQSNTASGVTSTQTAPAGNPSNTATLTVIGAPVITKSFNPTSVNLNVPSQMTITVSNPNPTTTITGFAFTDTYPDPDGGGAAAQMRNNTPANRTLNCTAGSTATATGGADNGVNVGMSGGSLAPGGSCTVTVNVESTAIVGTSMNYVNSTGTVTSTNAGTGAAASATLTVGTLTPPTVTKGFAPASVAPGATSVMTITLTNANAAVVTGVAFTDTYPAGLVNTGTPAGATTCPAGVVTAAAGGSSLAFTGSINAASSCTITVNVTSPTAGSRFNATGDITTANAGTRSPGATATLNVLQPPSIVKSYNPTSVAVNGDTTLTFVLTNLNNVALTGVTFTDVFPVGTSTRNAPAETSNCGGTFTDSGGGGIGDGDAGVRLNAGTIPANGTCTMTVTVRGTAVGTYNNTSGAVSATGPIALTGNTASATLAVGQIGIAKGFGTSPIAVNANSLLTFTISNSTGAARTGLAFTDTYPAGLVNATPLTVGGTCTGLTHTATAGGGTFNVTAANVAAGGCTITVQVTSAAPGTYLNQTSGATYTGDPTPGSPSNTASLVVRQLPVATKSFLPTTVTPGQASTLTITIGNPNGDTMTGVAYTDTFPAGMVVAATPNATNTCGGTFTDTALGAIGAGDTGVRLAAGSIPANTTCTMTVDVSSAAAGTFNNTTGAIASTNAGTGAAALATLVVAAAPTVAKSFAPATIGLNGTSTLTITLTNPNATVAVTGAAFTDTYPAGMANAATPNPSSSCGGTPGATAGGNTLTLTGGTIPAGGSCAVTVSVTATTSGAKLNNTGPVTTTNAGTGASASGTLTVLNVLTVAKSFTPTNVGLGQTSVLTITLTNSNTTPVTGAAFSDTYPVGLVNTAAAGGATTCGGSPTLTALNNGTDVSLSGATVPASGSCQVTVNVTSNTAGSYANTTDVVTTTNAGTAAAANATLTVRTATLAKAFGAASINDAATTTLVYTLTNGTGNPAQGGIGFVDTLRTGLAINSATPGLTYSAGCSGPANAAYVAGTRVLTLTGLAMANTTASCTVTVAGATNAAQQLNAACPAVNFTNGAADMSGLTRVATTGMADVCLVVNAVPPTVAKTFGAAAINDGAATTLVFTLTNTGTNPAQSGIALGDTLPTSLRLNNAAPAVAYSAGCSGPAAAVYTVGTRVLSGLTGIAMTAGTASCTVTVAGLTNLATAVNASCAGNPAAFTNLSANVTTTNATVTAGNVCLVVNALAPTLDKLFVPTTIAAGGTSTLTFTITNTGTAPARAGINFTDNLPGSVRVAATPNVQTNCPAGAGFAAPGGGFTVAAAAGAATVVATNAQLTAGVASCQVRVDVTSAIGGAYTNNAASITGTANIDATGVTASTLTVNAVTPAVTKAFAPTPIASGAISTLTITLTNANTSAATLTAALTDTLPAGLSIAGTPNASTTCTGAGAVTTGANTVTLPAGRSIPAAAGVTPGTCTFQVDVTGTLGGTYANTIAIGALQTSNGNNAAAANANLVINNVAPAITKAFGAAAIASGGSTSLTLTLTNPNSTLATLTAALVDALPANLTTVAASIATTCGGTAPTQAAGNVTLPVGLTIPAGTGVTSGSCTVSVNVTSVVAGTYTNTIAIGALQTNRGNNAAATSANLNVFAPPTVTKAFNLPTIGQGQTSTMTIVVSSAAGNPGNLTGVTINDAYIGTLTNAAAGSVACTGAGTATLTGGVNGGTSVGFNAGTIVPGGSCTITQLVTATSTNVNTTTAPAATGPVALTGTAANATLTIVTPTVAKTFGAGTIADGASTTVVFTLTNAGTNPAHSGIVLTDIIPSSLRLAAAPAVAYSAGCSGPAAAAYNSGTGLLNGLTGIAITAGTASCTVTVSGLTNAAGALNASCVGNPAAFTNLAANVTATNATVGGGNVCLVVTAGTPTLNKAFSPTTIAAGGTSTLTFTIANNGTNPARAGINFTDNLPGAVRVAATPNVQTNCPAGAGFAAPGGGFTVAAAAGAATVVATNAQLNNGVASCQVRVDVTAAIGGAYTNNAASITGTANIDATTVTPSTLTVNAVAPTVAKAFGTNPIASGGTSTLTITLTNANTAAATLTAALTDTLPAGLSIAGTPNASTTCTGAGAVTTGANSVTLPAGRSIPAAVGVTPGTCTFQVDVTGTLGGTYTNTIAAGALQTSNGNNAAAANANLTITGVAPSVVKTFGATNIATGGTTTLTLALSNPNASAATLTAALVDTLPAGLTTVAATVAGTCGGTAPTQAAGNLTLPVGLSIPAGTGVTPGTCNVTVTVTSAAAGTYVNTIAIGALQTNNGNNAAATSATLNVYAPPTVTKAFNLASIGRGQTSTMTIVVSNPAANPGNLTGVAVNDAYIGTLTNAAAGGVACTGAGTATLTGGVNGGTSVGFNAGTIVPGGSCTITQLVTATSTNVNTTTAPTATGPVALTGTAANATLTIVTPTVAKTFGAGTIADGGATTVVFTLTNSGTNPAHSGIVLTDIIPSSLRLPAAPAVAYSAGCSGPAAAAYNSGTGLLNGLTGIAITAGTASCTVTVSGVTNAAGQVNPSCVGNPAAFTNLAANVTATNATVGGGNACLVVTAGTTTLNKAFSPTTIAVGGTSTLTFTITNTGTNPARAGINFTDNLPGAVRVAGTPNIQTNCPAGGAFAAPGGGFTVAAAAGAASIVATNAQMNNGVASCQVRVDVTAAIGGAYTNNAASITGTANIDATAVTPSTLTVNAAAPTVAKAFGTNPIASGGTSTLTITLTNANASAATLTAALTDTLPAGLAIAGTPNASTTCTGAGAVTTGANTVTLPAGRSIPAAVGVTPGTCTFQVDVTGTLGGTYTNTIAAGALQTSNGNNAAAANANLTITAVAPTVVKAFGATNIATGASTSLTLTLTNANNTAASLSAALVDTLPAGLTTVAATVATTCGGTAPTQAPGNLTLPVGLSVPAGTGVTAGACTVTVNVTSATPGAYVNTIAAGALQTNNGNNAAPTSATLNVFAPPTATKSFNLASIGSGQTSTMTIVVSSAAGNPGNLTGVSINDAYIGTLTNAAAGSVACTGAGTATLTGGVNGGTSVGFNAGTIVPGGSCTITQLVTATSTNVNTTTAPAATGPIALTGTAASATLTVATPTVAKTFGAAAITDGLATTLVFTLTNTGANPAQGGIAIGDTLPSGLRLNSATPAVAYSAGCNGPAAAAFNAGTGVLSGLTGIAMTAGTASCTVTLSGLTNTAGQVNPSCPAANFTNLAANVTATNASVAGGNACLVVNRVDPVLSKVFAPATIDQGGTSTLVFTLTNQGTNPAQAGINFTDNLPAGVTIAGTPNVQSNCPAGGALVNNPAFVTTGAASVTVTGAAMTAATVSCEIRVNVTSVTTGVYTNTAANIAGAANVNTTGLTATLTVQSVPPLTKAFGTATVAVGGTSTLVFTINNTAAGSVNRAGISFTDTLPAGIAIANPPVPTTNGNCGGLSFTAVNNTQPFTASAVSVNAGQTCTITLSIRGVTPGVATNGNANITAFTGVQNNVANQDITVVGAPTIAKAFAPASIAADGTSTITFSITNPNAATALTGAGFTDTLANMVIAAAGAAGGTCTGAAGNVFGAGNTNLVFTGLTLAANATCTVTVVVTSDILGTHPNQASGVSSVQGPTGAASNIANLTVTAAAPSITKGFAPAAIAADGTSTITFTIANTNGSTLTAAGFTDTLTNMSIAAAGAAAGTCAGAGTNNFAAGATNLAFTGLTIPANGSCTVTVVVTSDVPGTHNNQASGVSSAQAATGAASNVATLTVNAATPTIAKAFGPASIALGGTSTITFTLANTNGVALTAATFSDTLANMAIAAAGAAGGTCAGAGTNNFAAGATNLAFTGLTIPANGACTVTVVVTSATPGTHPNQATGVASTQSGAAGAPSNTANLTVTALAPTISKSFAPATIASGGTSTLTVRIDNPNGAAITVTGVTDTFPAGVSRAGTPAASTTCAGGAVSSTVGSVTLTGGTVPATGFCTFQINVTAATQGSFVNTIPAGALTTNVGANAAAASATLTVTPVANVGVIKVGPATIGSGSTITYTVSITNAGPDAANATTFADAVPAAVTGVTANCGGAVGGAVCGAVNVAGNNVTGTVTTLPAGASVQITIQGTAQGVGPITNTATVAGPGGVTDPDNVNNTSSVTTTILAPDLTLTKTHVGNFTVGVNGVYTLTVTNGAGSLSTTGNITVVDTLPTGLSFVSAVGTGWACGAVGQVVTCTSGTAVAAGAMGNPITLTVGVASTAVPSVLNMATVSGGGEPAATANNNQASDNTIVVAAAVNTFAPDNAQAGAPGTTLFYPHTFNAGSAGNVTFATSSVQTPVVPGWTQLIYRDTNCNGVLDGAEGASPLAGPVAVAAGGQVCIVVRDNIPAAAPYNAQNVISVTATFNGAQNYTRTDTTTVGASGTGLTLAKAVRNVTQGGAPGTTGTALPNDVLEYTITYTNTSNGAISAIVITDATPPFTLYQAAACGAPLPGNITACNVTAQPAVNGTGSVIWTLTGSLLSGGSGSVSFTVRVQP